MKTNKIFFRVGKIEFLLFTSLKNQWELFQNNLNGKKLYERDPVDSNSTKLSKSNHYIRWLSKLWSREYWNMDLLYQK